MIFIILSLLNIANTKAVNFEMSFVYGEFSCLRKSGYELAIVRGSEANGEVIKSGLPNLRNIKAAGLTGDVYFQPCMGKVSVDTQVTDFVNAYGNEFRTAWIDVELNSYKGCEWTSDIYANCAFLEQIVQRFKDYNISIGIYSGVYLWESIFGNRANCPSFTDLPLWYAHYDNNESFNDYEKTKFGGWTQPAMKQYKGNTSVCGGIVVDLNYY